MRLLAAMALGMVIAGADSRAVIRVYDLGLVDAHTAAAVVRPLLSPGGLVVEDLAHHRLVVTDRPEVHERVAAAMRTIAVTPRNVRIQVTTDRRRDERQRSIEGAGRVGVGGVGVALGRRPPGRGVEVRGGASSSSATGTSRQEILVLSGSRASIRVAEEVPYPQWFWTWGLGRGLWVAGTEWHDVETSLVVEPRVLGDGTLHVRLTPRFDYRLGAQTQSTEVNELSTEVVVREGEEIELGGVPFADQDFRERFLFGLDESGQTVSVAMRLKATVE